MVHRRYNFETLYSENVWSLASHLVHWLGTECKGANEFPLEFESIALSYFQFWWGWYDVHAILILFLFSLGAFRIFFLSSLFWKFMMMDLGVSLFHSFCSTWYDPLIWNSRSSVHIIYLFISSSSVFCSVLIFCNSFSRMSDLNWFSYLVFLLLSISVLFCFIFWK